MPTLGPMELVLILAIVVLLFGAGKIPEIGGAVGKSIKEFRTSMKDVNAGEETADTAQSSEIAADKK